MNKLINDIKRYSEDNYENGYDAIVECYSDKELMELVDEQGIKTLQAFIEFYGASIDYANEIKSTIY